MDIARKNEKLVFEHTIEQFRVVVVDDGEVLLDVYISKLHSTNMVESLINIALGKAHHVSGQCCESMARLVKVQALNPHIFTDLLEPFVKGSVEIRGTRVALIKVEHA